MSAPTSDGLAHRSRELAKPSDEDVDLSPWVPHGIVSGVLGAAIVAVFFLAVDVWHERPFWTPTALGSAFFKGESLAPDASPEPVLIVGYTAMHGAVFLSIGLMAAYALASKRRRLAPAGLALAALLFVGFEGVFLSYTALLDAGLMATFGFGNVATANLLASGAMAAYLTTTTHATRKEPT